MNTEIVYEYWDGELKHQSKRRLALLEQAIAQTNAIITDRHESKYFKGKLAWRNPLLLKIKLPKGQRWKFVLASECTIWLAPPLRLTPCDMSYRTMRSPVIYGSKGTKPLPLRGNHTNPPKRRSYRFHPEYASIMDFKPELEGGYEYIVGHDIVAAILDGDLDLIL